MNRETGEVGLGVRINFHDDWEESHEAAKIVDAGNSYSIGFRQSECDGWLVFSGESEAEGPWLFLNRKKMEELTEVLCEL